MHGEILWEPFAMNLQPGEPGARGLIRMKDMQARSLQKGLEEDSPEAVKSSVTVLPLLQAPEGQSTGIVLQDWIAQVTVAMQDLSPSSGSWWSKVMALVQTTYSAWLGRTPLERLQLQPTNSGSLAEGRWTRVNARACSMLLQSLSEAVRQDLIARRVVQNAVLIMFRLHTTYQPGGASEKTLVLQNLQTPASCETLEEVLTWLRSWPRWIQRCQDLNMLCPDGTVLAKTLTSATSRFIVEGGDAQFRTQLLRSTLRIVYCHDEDSYGESVWCRNLIAYGSRLSYHNDCYQAQRIYSYPAYNIPNSSLFVLYYNLSKGEQGGAGNQGPGPSINVVTLKQQCALSSSDGDGQVFALVDSGATHALRRAKSESEWQDASPVTVNLAGGQSIFLKMNKAGTILVPITSSTTFTSTAPIVPLGALVGQLGYTMTWSSNKCRLEGRNGESFNLRVREGCPEITERDALKLIARLEDDNLEVLKNRTKETRQRVRAAALAMERTWFDHLLSYVDGELSSEALKAVETAPFLQDVPRQCVAGLAEAIPESNGYGHPRNGWCTFFREIEIGPNSATLKGMVMQTPLWSEYALEAGLESYNFDMAALGKYFTRHTTLGTNLPLRHLDGLRMRYRTDGPVSTKAPPAVWPPKFVEHVVIALRNWGKAGGTGRRHSRVEHPSAFVLSADLSGPVKVGGVDPDGRGAWVDYDEGEIKAEEYDDKDDGLASEGKGPSGEEVRDVVGQVDEEDDDPDQPLRAKVGPDDDLDLAAPELVNLIFSTGIRDDKAVTVLEAVQDVVLYCQSLNIPILRFHTDRGMEFQARGTKQWLKSQGIRVTTSEAGVHQTNGAAESTVRWIKQRARTLLLSAGLPQHLWPTAVATAATIQRSDVLGFEPMLAAPYGSKVMVRKRQLEGPKLDDLAPKWVQGVYVGRSESLSKGHLVFISNDEGEKFVHTLHVRAGLRDPGPVEEGFHVEEPGPPERRVRGKSAGSGDVVGVSKVTIFEDEGLQKWAEAILEEWSQEEAEAIVIQAGKNLAATENNYGMFRFGGRVGVTKATIERPWLAKIALRLLREKAPDAEFAAIFISVNNEREVHVDRNNAMGTLNYILPVVMPRRGGEIWQELRDGDVVSGRILELQSQDGRVRYGCAYPLQEGRVFHLNPHRRYAVLPWKGERLVVVGYTPGVLQNLNSQDRELLWDLGFPLQLVEEEPKSEIYINMIKVLSAFENKAEILDLSQEEIAEFAEEAATQVLPERDPEVPSPCDQGQQSCSSSPEVQCEEWCYGDLCLVLEGGCDDVAHVVPLASEDVFIAKAEVGFTENVELLLESLESPLSIVHTVDPREVARFFERWIPSMGKEVQTLEHAVERVDGADPEVRADIESGRGQVLPMKVVYTVKPPDPPADGEAPSVWYKRKSRIVVCGNFASHQPGEVYTNTAPAEIVRAAIALARFFNWDLGMIDV
ncbi:TY2B-B, partial [Symbiodinium sp. CCMP2592]